MTRIPFALLFFAVALATSAPLPAQDDPQDHSHKAMPAEAALDLRVPESGKWPSDESLRQGMRELKTAFEPAHDAYRNESFDADQAADLADTIEEKVNFMFANCRLPADADAELHKLLAAALGAAGSLRQSENLHEGLHRLHRVLQAYGNHFEHPAWTG